MKRYILNLTEEEREALKQVAEAGSKWPEKAKRARTLLLADEGQTDEEICEQVGVVRATVERVRKRACLEGIEAALLRKPQCCPSRKPVLDGKAEAYLVTIACSSPPEGRARWTATLLAERMVELEIVPSVSETTVRRRLKKNCIKPWRIKRFRFAGGPSPAFVAAMEDVLDIYHAPYDPDAPVVAFDECSKQLLAHVRRPMPAAPGQLARVDDEYIRCGTVNIFCAVEPLTGLVSFEATDRRTLADCGRFLKKVAEQYPEASRIILVSDNLNTHTAAALYAAFEPEQARELARRFEFRYTPKHGSWLNVAELELSVMARQCLSQRIETKQRVQELLAAWDRHRGEGTISWQFTTEQARIKLRRLYPSIQLPGEH